MQINSVNSENIAQTLVSAAQPQQAGASIPKRVSAPSSSTTSPDASVSLSAASLDRGTSVGAHVSPFQTSASATIAGRNYPESFEETDGVIVASVPSPPGATATGSSVESAEYNLQIKLDTLA